MSPQAVSTGIVIALVGATLWFSLTAWHRYSLRFGIRRWSAVWWTLFGLGLLVLGAILRFLSSF